MDWWHLSNIVQADRYLYPLVILIVTLILARATFTVIEGLLKFYHSKSKKFNKKLVSVIETPTIIIIILIGIELSLKHIIQEYNGISSLLTSLFIILFTYLLIRLGGLFLDAWSKRMTAVSGEEFHAEVLPLTRSVTSIIMCIIGVLLILQVWGVEIGALLASLGIAGLILGFAFKQTLENIFGGISLIVDNSFKKRDLITLESGEIGEVLEINLRSTKLKNFNNETIIVPNGQLANTRIINLAQPTPTVRVTIPVTISYAHEPQKVKKILHDAMHGNTDILKMPKRNVRVKNFLDFGIEYQILYYISNYRDIYKIQDQVLTRLYGLLAQNNIEIPFPIRTIVQAKKDQYKLSKTDNN